MLFDHGCDCFNSFLNGMAISKLFAISLNLQALALVMVVSTFYYATLEQYFTHYFYLPRINNVNEGIVLLVILGIIGGMSGGEIWIEEYLPGIKNQVWMLIILVISSQGAILFKYNHLI